MGAAGSAHDRDLLREAPVQEEELALPAPTKGQELAQDYLLTGLTHSLALLCERLHAQRFVQVEVLHHCRDSRGPGCGPCEDTLAPWHR